MLYYIMFLIFLNQCIKKYLAAVQLRINSPNAFIHVQKRFFIYSKVNNLCSSCACIHLVHLMTYFSICLLHTFTTFVPLEMHPQIYYYVTHILLDSRNILSNKNLFIETYNKKIMYSIDLI